MTSSRAPGPSGPTDSGQMVGGYRVLRACPVTEREEPSFVVWDPATRQQAVLQTYPATPAEGRKILLARLQNDADVSAGLSHPGVVRVISVGNDEALGPYLVREFVDGPSFRALPHMEVDLQAALSILIQAAHALVAADAAAVAPRNLRLEHLFVTRRGQVKVTVFGRPHITPPTPATSAFDLARVGLELITGQDPFPGGEAQGTPRIPVALDKGLTSAFTRALSAAPDDRFPGLLPFVQVLAAEAPLSEETRAELLELTDRAEPILEDARVAGWARDIWREDLPTSTPVPARPAGLPLASPPALRLVTDAAAEPSPAATTAEPPPPPAPATAPATAPPARPSGRTPAVEGSRPAHPTPPPRRAALGLALAAAAIALAAGVWYLVSGRPRVVEVVSTPPGAEVRMSGKLLGRTPLRVEAPAGGGAVTLTHEGYLPHEAAFVPGEEQLRTVLQPVPPPQPAPQEPAPEPATPPAPAAEATPPPAAPPPAAERVEAAPPAAKVKAKAKPAPRKPAPKPPAKKGFDLFQHLQKEAERG